MNAFANTTLTCLLLGVVSTFAGMDDAKLKEWLSGNFTAPQSMTWEEMGAFKEQYAVADDQLHRVLMDIYHEAEGKWSSLAPNTSEWNNNSRTVEGVIGWLPKCGGIQVKGFLMDYAASKENDSWLRSLAVLSYLRVANADEARDVLLRYLIGEERLDDKMRMVIYQHAQLAWYEVTEKEKKAAILAALYVALSVESPQWVFRVGDQIVQDISPRYARSRERFALLQKVCSQPFSKHQKQIQQDLESRLRAMRKLKLLTTVNTNLTTVIARDFNKPLTEEELFDLAIPPLEISVAEETPQDKPLWTVKIALYAISGGTVLALTIASAWYFLKRRGNRP